MDELTPRSTYEERTYDVLNGDDQAALEHYLSGGGREGIRGYAGPERRSPASRLDREIPVITGMRMRVDSPKSPADQLVDYFQDYGPHSWQEGRALFSGAAKRVESASRTRQGNPEAAVKDRYYTYSGYLLSSAEDKAVLDNLLTPQSDGTARPDIARLRSDRQALDIIARQFMNRGFLWDKRGQYWPSQRSGLYKERHQYWLGFALASARYASDESIQILYDFASSRTDRLIREWWTQIQQIEKMPIVQKLEREEKIIRLNYSKLWRHKAQLALEPEETAPESKTATDFEAMIPENVRQEIAVRRAREEQAAELADAEYDRELEKKMQVPYMTLERARKELNAQGIGQLALSDERFEEDINREIEDTSRRANAPKPPKKKKRRRFRRPLIGRAADTADSDKRVEDFYQDSLF
ncbi:MAG TPA: hypothetical protein VFP35_00715 [Candidatus Saccharimonadales bacterium]|nr:hypothetical protein [Candidatus Saccharimonadales bacterium]